MRTLRNFIRGLFFVSIAMLVVSCGLPTPRAWAQEDQQRFSKEELVQMLAPIALYPDSLIAQMLMAATYPLEIVEAERWLRDHRNLPEAALYEALREKRWDPSVKALCHFPDVLFAMSEKLAQTRKLGDAFLAQEQEVMDSIQDLRLKAHEAGTLNSGEEQKVIVERKIIRIEPVSANLVFVPVYDPYSVYGPWWYPDYPPYYWYYPSWPLVSEVRVGFGPGVFIGVGLFTWAWFDWNVHHIAVDVSRTAHFHRSPVQADHGQHYWQYDPGHRGRAVSPDRRSGDRFFDSAAPPLKPSRKSNGSQPDVVKKKAHSSPLFPFTTPSRERTPAPETRREPPKIQSGPPRGTSPLPPTSGREQTIVPDTRRGPQKIETVPPTPSLGRERIIVPEERGQSSPVQETPVRGIYEGRFEDRGERGEKGRLYGEPSGQTDRGRGHGSDSRGRADGPRR